MTKVFFIFGSSCLIATWFIFFVNSSNAELSELSHLEAAFVTADRGIILRSRFPLNGPNRIRREAKGGAGGGANTEGGIGIGGGFGAEEEGSAGGGIAIGGGSSGGGGSIGIGGESSGGVSWENSPPQGSDNPDESSNVVINIGGDATGAGGGMEVGAGVSTGTVITSSRGGFKGGKSNGKRKAGGKVKIKSGQRRKRGKWNTRWNMETKNAKQVGGKKRRIKLIKKTKGWRRMSGGSMLGRRSKSIMTNRWGTSALNRQGGQRVGINSMGLNRKALMGNRRVVKKVGGGMRARKGGLRFVSNNNKKGAFKRVGMKSLNLGIKKKL